MTGEDARNPIFQLARDLGLPDTFLSDLLKEDDWSFIIKLHALLEAVLTHLLTHTFGKPELNDIFSKLQFRGPTGKLEYIRALNLLNKNEIEFIDELTTIRNNLVHKIENVNFDLKKNINRYSKDKLKKYAHIFVYSQPQLGIQAKTNALKVMPKEIMVNSVFFILRSVMERKTDAVSKQELAQKGIEVLDILNKHRKKERK